jgi:SWI/SNF-related matrix-associated actin-dependent regulator 1 of chromatin subfamily A
LSQPTEAEAIPTLVPRSFSFDHLLPEGVWLYPHQACGVATALLERRLVLGDQMGLGKSAQALVAVEAAGAYPAVVACPASLAADWAGEIEYFLPHRRAQVASGAAIYWGADIVVVSYSLLHDWARFLVEDLAPRAVVLDESHGCANVSRRRGRAALALAGSVAEDGLVLSLTGAPLLNNPADVIAQLKLIGRLESFAGVPEAGGRSPGGVSAEAAFKARWCRDLTSQRQLHRALCQSCYVRRARKDVAPHEGSRRNVVLLTVALDAYQQAAARLAARLRRGEHAGHGEALEELRRLAGESKVRAARQWIGNFLVSNPGRKLVAYVQHDSVGEQLAGRFDKRGLVVAHLADSAQLVQDQDAVFVELGWSLHEHDQASLGSGSAFVWYLLAAGTIDLAVLASLEARRGQDASASSSSATAADVLRDLDQRGGSSPSSPDGLRPAPKVVPLRRHRAL